DHKRAASDAEIVPGNIHVAGVRRGRVVVSPARLSVVSAVLVNAEMSPAIRIRRISGLVPAQRAGEVPVQPDREPRPACAIVQNNWVAKGVGKRAVAAGVGDAGECVAAVSGTRYAREVARVGASRIVEGDANLGGIIRVSCNECLRLRRVGEGLSASDQVDVRATELRKFRHQFLDKPVETRIDGRRASLALATGKHDEAPSKALHPVDTQLVNLGTVKPRRQDANVGPPRKRVILLLRFCVFRRDDPGRAEWVGGKKRKRNAGHADQQGSYDPKIKEGRFRSGFLSHGGAFLSSPAELYS